MSRRTERVGEMLRRELAQMLIEGELRDPRLRPASQISITAVRVSGDLGHARVFFDVFDPAMSKQRVGEAFTASAGRVRHLLRDRVQMRRLPELHFEWDESVERGVRMEELFAELASERQAQGEADDSDDSDADGDAVDESADAEEE